MTPSGDLTWTDPRRRVPRTDVLLADPRLAEAERVLGRALVKSVVAAAQQRARAGEIEPEQVADHAVAALPVSAASLRPVINATGVVVHTNLGRAPLSQAAVDAVVTASGATDVEFDLETGRRARRGRGALAALARAVPTAGGVHVVNNNAAALLLTAMTLAPGKEIVVSRGELIEIGDGFRLPELMASTGSRIREVGTTNRTHLRDYADAIGPDTGFLLKVHPSNYHVSGFTSSGAGISELAEAAPSPLVVDIGSGLLTPHPLLPDEPDATSVLRDGADLVTASGDKLLGGPQAGLLFGTAELIERLRRHPAARALRVDKLTLAALEATLVGPPSPVAQALDADVAELRGRAERLAAQLPEAEAVDCIAAVGGGGAPGVELPSAAVSLPESYAAAAAHRHAGRGRPSRRRALPARPAHRRAGATTKRLSRRCGHACHSDRRACRPRQVDAGAAPHRHVARPARRGAAPRPDDRPRLRVDRRSTDRRFAFVDVPGHERFVANMLAGVGPAPAVMFVVAATEGWMPQSEEHLAALLALGVQHVLVVISKADLADPGPAVAQVRERLPDAPVVLGTDLDQVRAQLVSLVDRLPRAGPRRRCAAVGRPLVHRPRGGDRRHRNARSGHHPRRRRTRACRATRHGAGSAVAGTGRGRG